MVSEELVKKWNLDEDCNVLCSEPRITFLNVVFHYFRISLYICVGVIWRGNMHKLC